MKPLLKKIILIALFILPQVLIFIEVIYAYDEIVALFRNWNNLTTIAGIFIFILVWLSSEEFSPVFMRQNRYLRQIQPFLLPMAIFYLILFLYLLIRIRT